jgi:purine-binding chemotaxis protein CheW
VCQNEPVHETLGHLVFACGEALYALPSGAAAEVVNLPDLTAVPGAPAHVLGLFSLREELMPVVDLEASGGAVPLRTWKRAVVLRAAEGVVAIAVSRVLGVTPLVGTFAPVGESGLAQHLRGPLEFPQGKVSAIDPRGFIEFLARRG